MASMKSWMLGVALVAGAAGLGATSAQAAQFGIYVGSPAAYVPPSPGPGYVWVNGYYANGYYVAGRWNFAGYYGDRDRYVGRDRDDFYRGRDFDRHDRDSYRDHDGDRDRDRDRDRDHDRFRR
jgi:hypothetical protein